MSRWIGLSLIILAACANVSAQESQEKVSRAKMIISEDSWDFGFIPSHSFVSHTYRIRNIGKDYLIIERVRLTCGCTTAPLNKDKLAPGESTDLLVTFNSGKYVGPVRKGLYIVSNDSSYPGRSIDFSAVVAGKNPIATVTPEAIEFDSIQASGNEKKHIKLDNFSGSELKVSLIENPQDYLMISIKRNRLEPGGSTQVEVKLRDNLEPGLLKTSFTLQLESGQKLRVTIPVKAFIKG